MSNNKIFHNILKYSESFTGLTDLTIVYKKYVDDLVSGSTSGLTLSDLSDQGVQTLMKISPVKTLYVQNFLFNENIDLTTVANTTLITGISNKYLLVKNIKLIILNDADPDTFTISVGTNSSTYNNVVTSTIISDVLTNEYYNLPLTTAPAGSDGTIISITNSLIFRVSSAASTGTLNAHILLEGFIY